MTVKGTEDWFEPIPGREWPASYAIECPIGAGARALTLPNGSLPKYPYWRRYGDNAVLNKKTGEILECPSLTERVTGVDRVTSSGQYRNETSPTSGTRAAVDESSPTSGTRGPTVPRRQASGSRAQLSYAEQRLADQRGGGHGGYPTGIPRATGSGGFRPTDTVVPDLPVQSLEIFENVPHLPLPHELVDDDSDLHLPTIGQGGQMSPLMCGVKPDGRCTFLPLLSAGISSGVVTIAISTVASSTTLTMTNAPLTYADVRIRGVVAYFHALGTAAQLLLNAAVVSLVPNGGANCLYGEVPTGLEMTGIGTTAHARILATRLRKSPMLRVNQTATVQLRLRNQIANAAAIAATVTAYFIVDKVNDPEIDNTDCGCL